MTSRRTIRPPTITGARAGSRPCTRSRSASRSDARSGEHLLRGSLGDPMPMDPGRVVLGKAEVDRRCRGDSAGNTDRARDVELGEQAANVRGGGRSSSASGGSPARKRSVSRTHPAWRLVEKHTPSGPPTSSSVEPPPMSTISVSVVEGAIRRDAVEHRRGLRGAVEKAHLPAVALAEAVEERVTVRRRRAGRSSRLRVPARPVWAASLPRSLRARRHPTDRVWVQLVALVDALPEPRDREPADDFVDVAVFDVGDQQPRRVRAEIDRADPHRPRKNQNVRRAERAPREPRRAGRPAAQRDVRAGRWQRSAVPDAASA